MRLAWCRLAYDLFGILIAILVSPLHKVMNSQKYEPTLYSKKKKKIVTYSQAFSGTK